MNTYTVVVLVVVFVLAQANPARFRRDDRIEKYCTKHHEHYNKYCTNKGAELDRGTFAKLAKFCPAYEKHCTLGEQTEEEDSSLVMPPPLPKGNEFAHLDLPIGEETKRSSHSSNRGAATNSPRLTAAIIASCTPDCTAAHCTDECKCAHTHPKVHQMCNPPSSAQMAETCQRWYSKCTMFQPVQYY